MGEGRTKKNKMVRLGGIGEWDNKDKRERGGEINKIVRLAGKGKTKIKKNKRKRKFKNHYSFPGNGAKNLVWILYVFLKPFLLASAQG